MNLVLKQQLKHLSKTDYLMLKELSLVATKLNNEAIYNLRQYYFDEGEFLTYEKNYNMLKSSDNYKKLNANMAQNIIKSVNGRFKTFFSNVKSAKLGTRSYDDCKLPTYLPPGSFSKLVIGRIDREKNYFVVPFSVYYSLTHPKKLCIKIPSKLDPKKIKQIQIVPRDNARFFEIHYYYNKDVSERELSKSNVLALDLGVNNLVTGVTNSGKSFIIDGRRLKSINQWYNKENLRLHRIKQKQNINFKTKKEILLAQNRHKRIDDYFKKASRQIIRFCLQNDIGMIVAGYNEIFYKNLNFANDKNFNFQNIPFGQLRNNIEYLCKIYNIEFKKQEESYTSVASFWDRDCIPFYNEDNPKEYQFSGLRVKRGLYITACGKPVNADINAALNILKKSKVVSLDAIYNRGDVDTPLRIRID